MATTDPRIDAYIAKSPKFAKPILTHIRTVVHTACPDVEETMKWSTPHFYYEGQMLCGMAAFNEHAALNFWKAALIEGGARRAGRRVNRGGVRRATGSISDSGERGRSTPMGMTRLPLLACWRNDAPTVSQFTAAFSRGLCAPAVKK